MKEEVSLRDLIELRDELQDDLAAVSKVLAISRARMQATVKATSDPLPRVEYGAVGKIVEAALARCPEQFTFADVNANLERQLRNEQLCLAINRLRKRGMVAVLQPRKGRTPAIYKKL